MELGTTIDSSGHSVQLIDILRRFICLSFLDELKDQPAVTELLGMKEVFRYLGSYNSYLTLFLYPSSSSERFQNRQFIKVEYISSINTT